MKTASPFRATATASCAMALALLAGCTDDPRAEEAAVPEPLSASSAEAASAMTAEEAVLAAYTDMWKAAVDASHVGDAAPAGLERHATGGALELMRQALEGVDADGAEMSGEPVLTPSVTALEPGHAEITDCLDDSGWVAGSGASGTDGANRRIDAGITHDGLVWRVSELRIWEPGTC